MGREKNTISLRFGVAAGVGETSQKTWTPKFGDQRLRQRNGREWSRALGELDKSPCLVTCKKLWSKLKNVELERKSFIEEVEIKSKVLAIIKNTERGHSRRKEHYVICKVVYCVLKIKGRFSFALHEGWTVLSTFLLQCCPILLHLLPK